MKSIQFKQLCISYCRCNQSIILDLLKLHNDYLLKLFNEPNHFRTYDNTFLRMGSWIRGVKRVRKDRTILRIFECYEIHIAFITDINDNHIIFQSSPNWGFISYASTSGGFADENIKPYYDMILTNITP